MAGCDRFNCLEISITPSASPRLAEASFKWSGLSFKTLGKSVKLVSRSKLLLNKTYTSYITNRELLPENQENRK